MSQKVPVTTDNRCYLFAQSMARAIEKNQRHQAWIEKVTLFPPHHLNIPN